MPNSRFVVAALVAAASLAAVASPAAAHDNAPGDRPTVTLDTVSWHEPGTLSVKGTYSCESDAASMDSVEVWTEQWNVENDLWNTGYAVTAEGADCDGLSHEFEVTIQSEIGNYDKAMPVRVEAMAMTVKHRMSLIERYFLAEPAA